MGDKKTWTSTVDKLVPDNEKLVCGSLLLCYTLCHSQILTNEEAPLSTSSALAVIMFSSSYHAAGEDQKESPPGADPWGL